MHPLKNISEKISSLQSPATFQTLIELLGVHRVLIEHHHGILIYGSDRIRVSTTFGAVTILGENLRLRCMNREQLFITGDIEQLLLERDDAG